MSLVNDALQKVHAQTTQRQIAAVPGASGMAPYRFNKPRREPSRVWWLAGGAVVLVGLGVVVAVITTHRTSQLPPAPIAATPVVVAPARTSVPVVSQSPTTQPVAIVTPPPPPVQPIAPTPAASGLAPAPVTSTLPITATPATQPTTPTVAAPIEATPVVAATTPPATAPAPAAPTNIPAPAPAPVTAVIDLQSLNVPGLGKLKLTGIALSPFGTRAVINGTIISVGDTVGPATITDIQDKRVKLEISGKTYTLSLP